jgi:hypothetical protein
VRLVPIPQIPTADGQQGGTTRACPRIAWHYRSTHTGPNSLYSTIRALKYLSPSCSLARPHPLLSNATALLYCAHLVAELACYYRPIGWPRFTPLLSAQCYFLNSSDDDHSDQVSPVSTPNWLLGRTSEH